MSDFPPPISPGSDPSAQDARSIDRSTAVIDPAADLPRPEIAPSEALLQQLLAASPDCIKILDLDANLIWMSENGRIALEIDDPEPWLHTCWTGWWSGEDQAKVADAVTTAIAGSTARFEAFAPTAAGTPKWWEIVVSPIPGTDGRPERLLAISRDITMRKSALLGLQQSEARHQVIIENVRDFAIFALDTEGIVATWNVGAERLFGYGEQEIVGQNGRILFTPEDREANVPEVEMATARSRGTGDDERWHVRKDGTRFRASGTLSPILDAAGDLYGYTKVCRDITEHWKADQELKIAREQAEAAVESERSLLADIFNRSPAFMAVVRGPEHRFELANERYNQLVGHRTLIDMNVVEALPEVADQGFVELLDSVYRTGEPYIGRSIPILLQREPGQPLETRYLDFVYQPLYEADGSISGILAHGVDITERKLAEDTLRQSEASFRQLADALPQMVWTATPDGLIYYYNRRWYEYTGMPEDIIGDESWEPVLHPDDMERTRAVWEHSLRTGKAYELECRFRHAADGSYRWHLNRALPIFGDDGEIVRWFGSSTDIHDRRLSDEALRASEERLNAALAAAEMGTFRWEPDSGAFLDFDVNLSRLFDMPLHGEEVRLDDVIARVHPDDQPELRARIARSAAEGTDFEITFRVLLRDGSVRWLYDRAKMRQAEPERPRHLVGACVDITQRKLAEDAARQNAQRLLAIFNQATAGIAQTDRSGRFIEANARYCQIVGRSEQELAGMRMHEITHPDDLADNVILFDRLVTDGIPFQLTKRYIRPDGSFAWVENYISAVTDAYGVTEYIVVVTIDMTERMKVEEHRTRLAVEREQLLASERAARAEAEEASRMKDEFLATISHELRTPLNAIVGWSSLLQSPDTDAEMLSEGLDAIQRNARTQSRLIEDVLDVARITTGKVQLNIAPLRLCDTIESAVSTVMTEARSKRIRIDVDCAVPGEVLGDAERLQQVFWNLLSNAIKFTDSGGLVTVALESDGSSAKVSVTDTGSGIDPAFLPYVFERFRQADARITRREGGLGLGLSIVRNLVEMHRGSVVAYSDGPGTGSRFVVKIPLADDGGNREGTTRDGGRERSIDVEAARRLAGRRAIVLDDDADARRIVEATLSRCGMEVTAVASAADALAILMTDHGFDVVISDIGMPDEDGFQFIRRLRALESERDLSHLPAAALTAYTREQDRDRASEAGFDRFIAKPIHPHQLLTTVIGMVGDR